MIDVKLEALLVVIISCLLAFILNFKIKRMK
jgi:hypothetical protein